MKFVYHLTLLNISVGIPEIVLFLIGAFVLGFTLHYYISSRKALQQSLDGSTAPRFDENVDWKLKYFNDKDALELQIRQLEKSLEEARENEEAAALQAEELELQLMKIEKLVEAQPVEPVTKTGDYLQQLDITRQNLQQSNTHMKGLMEQIDVLQESEKKYQLVLRDNDALQQQLKSLRGTLVDKEEELRNLKQQQLLNREMEERLEKAYREFNDLQQKLSDVEKNLSRPNSRNIDYDSLQESYLRLTKDYDELKLKQIEYLEENHRLLRLVSETDDKLREANFQRLQQNKRLSFMEELNTDLQQLTERNKKLETHLKRLNEIETMLLRATRQKNEDGE